MGSLLPREVSNDRVVIHQNGDPMSEIQGKMFDLLYIAIPMLVIIILFIVLEKRNK